MKKCISICSALLLAQFFLITPAAQNIGISTDQVGNRYKTLLLIRINPVFYPE